eukprot:scaffold56729_cov42-Phaeocystis_antarctica.AAC.2
MRSGARRYASQPCQRVGHCGLAACAPARVRVLLAIRSKVVSRTPHAANRRCRSADHRKSIPPRPS